MLYQVQFRDNPKGLDKAQLGHERDFGLYSDDKALYGQKLYYFVWELPIFMALGVVCGLLGSMFVWLNVKMTSLRHKYIPVSSPLKRTIEVIIVAFVTSSLAFWFSYVSPCKELPPDADIKYLAEDETAAVCRQTLWYSTES